MNGAAKANICAGNKAIIMLRLRKAPMGSTTISNTTKATKLHGINISFFDHEKYWKNRKIKEAIYINAFNPDSRVSNLMNLEKRVSIAHCWSYFNKEIRISTQKKLSLGNQ